MDSASGGNVFPFEPLMVPDIFSVARFEIGIAFNELAIFDNAAADASGESKIKSATGAMTCFGEGSKIGVVLEINRKSAAEVAAEQGGEVEIVPREITEPDSLVALDDARHGDADGFDIREDEIDANLLKEIVVENALVGNGGKANRMQNFARLVE